MKISWLGFSSLNHSWSIVAQNTCRALSKQGHDVHMFSTNGIKFFPDDLKHLLVGYIDENTKQVIGKSLDNEYDCQLTYTYLQNFGKYLSNGKRNRFAHWNYEFAGNGSLPQGSAKHYKYCDKLIAASQFSKQIFIDNGIPNDGLEVIPHGIDVDKFINNKTTIDLKTNKRVKILVNIAQPHLRKNIDGVLDTYGKAFTNTDDVVLVIKVVDKKPEAPFEMSFSNSLNVFKKKFSNHADIIVLKDFITDIDQLYRSCDILFGQMFCEAFWMPGLEALAAGLVVVAPKYGGQMDYLTNDNSLLIDGKITFANSNALYWQQNKRDTLWYQCNQDNAVSKLRYAYDNIDILKTKFNCQNHIKQNYSWGNVANKIMELTK